MGQDVGVVVRRLRARRREIEDAILAGVREAVPEPGGAAGAEYLEGLRAAVVAAVGFGLAGLERGVEVPGAIPPEAVAQAQLAARSGVSLEAVLRRYIVGHALLWDYVMQEADRVQRLGRASGLREMSRAQSAILDQLVIAVTREHIAELQRATRSREQRLLERVRILLAGEHADAGPAPAGPGGELDYDLTGQHLGVIALGAGGEAAMRALAQRLRRRLLWVAPEREVVWAWLGGRDALPAADLERACAAQTEGDASMVLGEPAVGVEGWRLTHRQAQAALLVVQRRPRRLTRYADVALLAAALDDAVLARSLNDICLAPLEGARGGAPVLHETLRAYFAAERNASSAASALGIARSTVESRLRTVEERLGRPLHTCAAELEVALRLAALEPPADDSEDATLGRNFT
jgi:PucR C-terminal helix-turn-helix domain/GGDEF-like domain